LILETCASRPVSDTASASLIGERFSEPMALNHLNGVRKGAACAAPFFIVLYLGP
jgi:hypothetical protein